jgi:hypothetical protein
MLFIDEFYICSKIQKDVLIEFKAGQMFKENNSKWVYPDKRKGLIILKQVILLLNCFGSPFRHTYSLTPRCLFLNYYLSLSIYIYIHIYLYDHTLKNSHIDVCVLVSSHDCLES